MKDGFTKEKPNALVAEQQAHIGKDFGTTEDVPNPELTVERLKAIKQEKNLTNAQFAHFAGVSETTISHTLNGHRVPKVKDIEGFARGLHVRAQYLLGEDDNRIKAPHKRKVRENDTANGQMTLNLEDTHVSEESGNDSFTEADSRIIDKWVEASLAVLRQQTYDEPQAVKSNIALLPLYVFVRDSLISKDVKALYECADAIGTMLHDLIDEFMEETK